MKKYILSFALLFINVYSYSQDLMCGAIAFSNISGYTYQINGAIYAQASTAIKRTYFIVNTGEGYDSVPVSPPVDSSGTLIYYFSITHTYPGQGIYSISVEGDFLIDSVANVPNSVHQPLYLSAQLIISPVTTFDNSPVFNEPLIDYGPEGIAFIYNPRVYDADNDSLSYSLVPIDSVYSFDGISIDSVSGDIRIDHPQSGRYLFEIKVTEWRLINGNQFAIGYVENIVFFYFEKANGINEVNGEETIILYPNPATNQLTIHTSSFQNEAATVSIMNVLGQEVAHPPSPSLREGEDALIDVSKLAAGIYFVQLKTESPAQSGMVKRFVKE